MHKRTHGVDRLPTARERRMVKDGQFASWRSRERTNERERERRFQKISNWISKCAWIARTCSSTRLSGRRARLSVSRQRERHCLSPGCVCGRLSACWNGQWLERCSQRMVAKRPLARFSAWTYWVQFNKCTHSKCTVDWMWEFAGERTRRRQWRKFSLSSTAIFSERAISRGTLDESDVSAEQESYAGRVRDGRGLDRGGMQG